MTGLSSYTVTIIPKEDPLNVIPSAPIEIRERLANGSSGGLSLIFSNQAGTTPITQTGATANDLGQFTFFAAAGNYNAVYDNEGVPVTIAIDVGITNETLSEALIADLSQAYEFDDLDEYKTFNKLLPAKKIVYIKDINAKFINALGIGTGNDANIIDSTAVSQHITLVDEFKVTQWSAIANGVADDTTFALLNFASGTTELRQVDKLTIKGFDTTGLHGAGRDGIGTLGLSFNGNNGLIQSVTDYFSVLAAYDDTTRPSDWTVRDINITSPFVPQKDGTVFPGLGLADDHFAYQNRGGRNHIVSGVRVLGSDDGVTQMFGDVGVDASRIVENGVYSDIIMDDISNLALQIDTSKFAAFNNIIIRGNEHNLPASEFAGAAMGHGVRLLSQQGIVDAECRFNRVDNVVVDNYVNAISAQTGHKNCNVNLTAHHTKRLIEWKAQADDEIYQNSIRCNKYDISFYDTLVALEQETSFLNSYHFNGEKCTGLLSQPTPTTTYFDGLEHNIYDFHAVNISQNAIGFKANLSHLRSNMKGLLANATNRPFIIDSDCNRSKIDLIASEFNQGGVFTANSCSVSLIQKDSGNFNLDGMGNIVERIDSSSRVTVSGKNNILTTDARELRDVAGMLHNTLIVNNNATDSNNPMIVSSDNNSLNLVCEAIVSVSTAISINGDYNSGIINAHHVNAVPVSVGGDRNCLTVVARRDDTLDALTVGGNGNMITVTSDGIVNLTGNNNVIVGIAKSLSDTGAGNDTTALKLIP